MRSPMSGEDPEGTAVNRQSFNIDDCQAVTIEQRQEGGQREVEHVLVVDRIEFHLLNQVTGIGELEDDAAFWFQEQRQARNKVVDGRRVSQDIIPQNHISSLS